MQIRDIILIGASAGGLTALKVLVSSLPQDFKGSIFIVLHIAASSESRLPWILEKAGALTAMHLKDRDIIEQGKIYVTINDHHLILEQDQVRVSLPEIPKELRTFRRLCI
jgi:two-component system chemotaxis response regulator CheB